MNKTISPIIGKVKANAERDVLMLSSVEAQITAILEKIECRFDTSSDGYGLQLYLFSDSKITKRQAGEILSSAFPAWVIDRHDDDEHQWASANAKINDANFIVTLYANARES